jgi:hypothetical protein
MCFIQATKQKNSISTKKALALSLDKEKDQLKTIRGLEKQVRTLQKILYTKDPGGAAAAVAFMKAAGEEYEGLGGGGSSFPTEGGKDTVVAQLENRITELEQDLAKADSDSRERLKDFQVKLQSLKVITVLKNYF